MCFLRVLVELKDYEVKEKHEILSLMKEVRNVLLSISNNYINC